MKSFFHVCTYNIYKPAFVSQKRNYHNFPLAPPPLLSSKKDESWYINPKAREK